MKALTKTILVLVGCVVLDPALAPPAGAAADDRSVADTINQLDRDWADSMIHGNLDRLNQIVADDWVEGYPDKPVTKDGFLSSVKSGAHKLESCEFGPRDVKVLGNVAVVQGSATEVRKVDGQSTTLHVAYMDVWVKRGDRWVVIRSRANKL